MEAWGLSMLSRYLLANAVVWPLLGLFIAVNPFGAAAPLFGTPGIGELLASMAVFPIYSFLLVGLPTLLFMAVVGNALLQTDNVWCWRLLVLAAIGWFPWIIMTSWESPMALGYGSLLSQILFALLVPAMSRTKMPRQPRSKGPVA